MRIPLVVTGVLLLVASAQVEANPVPGFEFGFFADAAASIDTVLDDGPGTLVIYIVLRSEFQEYSGIRFSAPNPPCFAGTLLDETYEFPATGDAQNGVWVAFGGCEIGSILIGTLTFTVEGLTGDCCWYVPQPHSAHAEIWLDACPPGYAPLEYPPVSLLVNPNDCPSPAPVKDSTWGKIKSLYYE